MPVLFLLRQPGQPHDGDAPGQRLRNAFHEVELLGSGQPEHAGPALRIRRHLDVREQLRRVLDFVDQHGSRETLHEQGGVFFRQLEHKRIVQRNVTPRLLRRFRQAPEQRRFPDLTGPRHQHGGEKPGSLSQKRRKRTGKIHTNLGYYTFRIWIGR